jgi:para-aminobenzoate synthetase / 4-amino-4-deoxychorismate lyase
LESLKSNRAAAKERGREKVTESMIPKNAVLLETTKSDAENGDSLFFQNPIRIVEAASIRDVEAALREVDAATNQGYYAAGYLAYEAGFAFERVFEKRAEKVHLPYPLVWFGIYDHAETPPENLFQKPFESSSVNAAFSWDESAYTETIERIKEYIRSGDVYQINFTGKFQFDIPIAPFDLYQRLRAAQRVPFGAYLRTEAIDVLSFSPELFFRTNGSTIETKPMKGTAPRGTTTAEDRRIAEWLQHDEKNRAENVMIVDLLRNDIGRLCKTGSVHVPKLFEVETYQTLFQMTSLVRGELHDEVSHRDIFSALFPCGSITGAPKIRAMQVIDELEELEASPRGIYTGTIGYIAPKQNSPKQKSVFNVAIRTLVIHDGKAELGAGSGITYDSEPHDEYAECLLKTKFLNAPPENFHLFESLGYSDKKTSFLDDHLERLKDSAEYFGFPFNEKKIRIVIKETLEPQCAAVWSSLENPHTHWVKAKLILTRNGDVDFEISVIAKTIIKKSGVSQSIAERNAVERNAVERNVVEQNASGRETLPKVKILFDEARRVNSADKFFYHKTTRRNLYDVASRQAAAEGLSDFIFLNERGEVSEGAISNIWVIRNGEWLTPPVTSGLLAGIYRNHILKTNPNARERVLYPDDLKNADELYLCNAVRGLWRVELVMYE